MGKKNQPFSCGADKTRTAPPQPQELCAGAITAGSIRGLRSAHLRAPLPWLSLPGAANSSPSEATQLRAIRRTSAVPDMRICVFLQALHICLGTGQRAHFALIGIESAH